MATAKDPKVGQSEPDHTTPSRSDASPTNSEALPSLGEALRLARGKRSRHLLIGNGFSLQAGLPFATPIINHFAMTYPLGARASQLLNNLPAIAPEDSLTYVTNFPAINYVTGERSTEYTLLRHALVEGIIDAHPEARYAVRRAARSTAASLLDQFNSVFTTNYDLMAYWAMQEVFGAPAFTDHFRPGQDAYSGSEIVELFVDRKQRSARSLWYLHGAIHLYQFRQRTAKVTMEGVDASLQDAVRDARDNGGTPLIVLEGSSKRKRDSIDGNRYLRRAFRELSQLQGVLFTFGFGFNWQDAHLTDAILRNRRLSTVWVGVYGDPSSAANIELRYRIEERRSQMQSGGGVSPMNILFYQSQKALDDLIG